MLYTENNYMIRTIDKTEIDELFIKLSSKFQKQFPFKWDFFVNDILSNPEITYFKDTTAIFNLETFSFDELPNLFNILKMYLNYRIISKIIQKKEFIIAHFNSDFHMEFIKTPTLLLSLGLYNILKKASIGEVYLGAILFTNNQKRIINLVIKNIDSFYLFDGSEIVDYKLNENCKVIRLYNKLSVASLNGQEDDKIKLTYYEGNYKEKLAKHFGI